MNSKIHASSSRSRGSTARDDNVPAQSEEVNPEENQWIESPIHLPLSPIRLPLRAKKNGWVRLNEVDMMGLALMRRARCR